MSKGFEGVVRCQDCHFIFAIPGPDSSASEFYDEEWAKSETHPTFIYRNGQFVVRHPEKIHAILGRIERFRKLNRLLDVGCSAAFFLKLAQEKGWNVQGVEVSDFGTKYTRETLKIEVFQGLLHEAAFPDNSFDVVFNSHVLEHVGAPRDFVREIHRILRPGGALITVIPTQYVAPGFRLFGRLSGEGPPRHVSFFSSVTFNALMKSEGFDVVGSYQNIELQRLFPTPPASSGSEGTTPASPISAEEDEARRAAQSRPVNPVVKLVKSGLNAIGSVFDTGDELTTIAVKRER